MDLKQALEHHAPNKKKPCKLARILASLSEEDQETFWSFSALEGMSSRRLADALTDAGHPISDDAVERHINLVRKNVKKKCCCPAPDKAVKR